MVLQVKSLLDMARSIPRPKSPGRRTTVGNSNPTRGNGNVNFLPPAQHHVTRSIPPDPIGASPGGAMARKGETGEGLSPPRMGASNSTTSPNSSPHFSRSIGSNNADSEKPAYPYRYYSRSAGASSSGNSPQRGPLIASQNSPNGPMKAAAAAVQQHSPVRYSKQADYLEPPKMNRRSLLDQEEPADPPEKPRHALSPTMNSQAGRQSFVSSSASTVKMGLTQSRYTSNLQPQQQNQGEPRQQQSSLEQGVFRQGLSSYSKEKDVARKLPPPMMEVTVSQDEDDDGLYNVAALQRPAQTDIFISPHYVPHMSPHKVNHMGSSQGDTPSRASSSTYSGIPISPASDGPLEVPNSSAIVKQYSYDAEESCLLTDGAPKSLAGQHPEGYDSLSMPPTSAQSSDNARKIMVVRPYRSTPDESITSPTSVVSTRSQRGEDNDDIDIKGATAASRDSLYGSDPDYSSKTSSWSQANQKDSSVTLSRARALLQANREFLDSPQVQLAGKPPYLGSPDRVKQQLFRAKNRGEDSDLSYDQDLEDGLAPLGASDASVISSTNKGTFRPDMLTRPQEHLPQIYAEASRYMKVSMDTCSGKNNEKRFALDT